MRWTTLTLSSVLLFAAPRVAGAQASTTPPEAARATSGRGALAVVGLRAPSGEVELAADFSRALREMARAAGYTVSDDAPALDQEYALVGCSTNAPDCLSLISDDLHAPRFLYGLLRREGRGADATMTVELSLWDGATRRELPPETATITRAQLAGRPASLRDVARTMLAGLFGREDAALRAERELAARNAQQALGQGARTPPVRSSGPTGAPSHTLRWVGFGLIGAGVAAGGIGVWQWARSSSLGSDSQDAGGANGLAWARYDNVNNRPVNGVRPLSVDDVCTQAAGDANTNPDAAAAHELCSANSTSRALAWGLGIGGLVFAGAGAALVVLDSMRSNNAASEGAPPPALARLRVTPVLGPSVGGVDVGLTF